MASNKTGIRGAKTGAGAGLGGALIRIFAAGVALGAALIGGAKVLGEAIEEIEAIEQKKLEERRAADREEVRRIDAAESGTDYQDLYQE